MRETLTIAEKLAKRKIKTPPPVIYPLLARLWQLIYFKKLGVHVTDKVNVKSLKGPFIVVSNHASRLDYIYTGIPFLPHRLNYVAGYNEFFRSHLAFIFRLLQIIPKRNFTPDVYAVKEISRILRAGGKVILFPEGMSSISGANQPCAMGSGKLLKHFAVPVYQVRISGGYLTSTKYCLDERPGRVEVEIDSLFIPEQLKAMTAEQIQDTLNRVLYNDDYAWNKTARAAYQANGRMAQALHTLLFRCPRCGAEFTMLGEGNSIGCMACGNGAVLNEHYDLIPYDKSCVIPGTPREWFDQEREQIRREIKQADFCLREKVRLGVLPKYHYLKDQATSLIVGQGELTLTRDGFHYDGVKDGAPFSLHIPPALLPTFGMCTDVSRFYTFHQGEFYEFYPERASTEKWFMVAEELHRLCGGSWQDFKPEEG